MIKMKLLFVFGISLLTISTNAQSKLFTKKGVVTFVPQVKGENITATNKQGVVIIDLTTNTITANVLLKGFVFEQALMQEHFNDEYVESTKYPKAEFTGKFNTDKLVINLSENKTNSLTATGSLKLHGVTKPLTAKTVITVANGIAKATASFSISLPDYKIGIPWSKKPKNSNLVDIIFDAGALDKL